MVVPVWQQWEKRPKTEPTLIDRAQGKLPPMESTKQLAKLVSQVYQPGMRVLDVGCNVGHYLRGLREIDGNLIYKGVDAYVQYIDSAKEIFAKDRNASFEVKDIFQSLFPHDPYDITYCCNVLLHLPDFRAPVRNLLASTRSVLFIRLLLGDNTTIVKRAVAETFDDSGNPLDFVYQNTWQREYFSEFVRQQGWNVELIADQFDPSILNREYQTVNRGSGTRVVDGMQADGNIIFNWTWAKITRAT
jgi:SAM-dependent methyltransferase